MSFGGVQSLRDWSKGDRISSLSKQQQNVDGLRDLYGMIQGMIRSRDDTIRGPRLCRVTDKGPKDDQGNDTSDLKGCMYWVMDEAVASRDGTDEGSQKNPKKLIDPIELLDISRDQEMNIFPATNLEEFVNDTHFLIPKDGEPVMVYEWAPLGTGDNYRVFLFFRKPKYELWVQPTRKAVGHGKYVGRRVSLPPTDTDITESSDLASADIGGADFDSDELIIINAREEGDATWDLWDGDSPGDNAALNPAIFRGTIWHRNADGKLVVLIDGMKTESCP